MTETNNLAGYVTVMDALILPYGGQKAGNVDCAGERFTPKTDFMETELPFPPIVYAHGHALGPNADEAGRTVVGRTISRWRDTQGGWAKIGILPTVFSQEILDAQQNGTLGFSTTALLKKMSDNPGDISTWLTGEISVLTDKTGVPPCNLLARPADMSKAELGVIVNSQPDALKEQLLTVMGLPEDYLAGVVVADGTNPVNPDADPATDGGITFPLDITGEANTEGETEMTPEEIQATVAAAVAPLVQKMDAYDAQMKEKCGCSDTTTATVPVDSRSKADLVDYLKSIGENAVGDTEVNTSAILVVDSFIKAGRLDPVKRLPAINGLVRAIDADGRQKMAGGAVEDYLLLIGGAANISVNAAAGLQKFDFKGEAPKAPAKEDIDMMAKAALE